MLSKDIRRRGASEAGFTLIELLVVITILGILAAIVVFSVGGAGTDSQAKACEADFTTLQTAEEAHFAKNNKYASEAVLTQGGSKFLAKESKLHDIQATDSDYTIVDAPGDPDCPAP